MRLPLTLYQQFAKNWQVFENISYHKLLKMFSLFQDFRYGTNCMMQWFLSCFENLYFEFKFSPNFPCVFCEKEEKNETRKEAEFQDKKLTTKVQNAAIPWVYEGFYCDDIMSICVSCCIGTDLSSIF